MQFSPFQIQLLIDISEFNVSNKAEQLVLSFPSLLTNRAGGRRGGECSFGDFVGLFYVFFQHKNKVSTCLSSFCGEPAIDGSSAEKNSQEINKILFMFTLQTQLGCDT